MTGPSFRATLPGSLTGLVTGGVTVFVLALAFGLSALDLSWAWVVYPLGFGGLLPLAMGAAARHERRTGSDRRPGGTDSGSASADTALEDLRRRYARGEVEEAEFERRVERLLRTETVDETREYLDGAGR